MFNLHAAPTNTREHAFMPAPMARYITGGRVTYLLVGIVAIASIACCTDLQKSGDRSPRDLALRDPAISLVRTLPIRVQSPILVLEKHQAVMGVSAEDLTSLITWDLIRNCEGRISKPLGSQRITAIAAHGKESTYIGGSEGTIATVKSAYDPTFSTIRWSSKLQATVGALQIKAEGLLLGFATNGQLNCWDLATGDLREEFELPTSSTKVAFDRESRIAAAEVGQTVRIIDLTAKNPVRDLDVGAFVSALTVSDDRSLLATATAARHDIEPNAAVRSSRVDLWSLQSGQRVATMEAAEPSGGSADQVWLLAFVPSGKELLVVSTESVRAIDVSTGRVVRESPRQPSWYLRQAAISDDRTLLVFPTQDGLSIFRVESPAANK